MHALVRERGLRRRPVDAPGGAGGGGVQLVVAVVAAVLGGAGGGGVQPVVAVVAAVLGGAGAGGVQPVAAVVAAVLVVAGARQRCAGGGGFHAGAVGLAVLLLPERFGGGIFSGIVFSVGTAPVSPEGKGAPLILRGGSGGIARPRCAGHGPSGGGGGAPFLSVVFSSFSVG